MRYHYCWPAVLAMLVLWEAELSAGCPVWAHRGRCYSSCGSNCYSRRNGRHIWCRLLREAVMGFGGENWAGTSLRELSLGN